MNLIILTAVIAIASAGQLPSRSYIPQGQNQAPGQGSGGFGNQGGSGFGGQGTHGGQGNFGGQSGSGSFGQGGHSSNFGGSQGFGHQAQNGFGGSGGFNGNGNGNRPQQSKEANAAILKQDQGIEESGSYHFGYETENGIRAEEAGNPSQAQGGFSYKGDDGHTYTITYTSGEGGFRPQGEHLPVAPPTPEAILEALQKNAQDEAAGIFDDGLYRPGTHSGPGGNRPGQSGGHFGNSNRPGQGHGGQGQSGFGGHGNHQNGFNANSGYTY